MHFSHFLRKVVCAINVSILCVNITKLSFVCMRIKLDFSYFQDKLIVLIRGMFRKKYASSNLKRDLYLETNFSQKGAIGER